jgi:hypothetical protein
MSFAQAYTLRFVVILTASLLAVSPVLASPAPGPAQPRAVVLHLKDLPSSLRATTEKGVAVQDSDAAVGNHVSTAQMNRHGYVAGYANIIGNKDKSHLLALEDHVVLFRSAAGARWQYQKFLTLFAIAAHQQKLNTSGIGDQSAGYFSSSSVGGLYTVTLGQVYFRRGPYAVRINIQDYGPIHASDLVQLARLQDARIERSG